MIKYLILLPIFIVSACQSFEKLDKVSSVANTYPVLDPENDKMNQRVDFVPSPAYPQEIRAFSFVPYQNESGKISKTTVKIIER